MGASSKAAPKCFLFMYFLQPHWVPATWRSRAQTSIRAEFPSGNVPITRVRRRISRFSRSIGNSWARDGITVNCICPGYFPTEMTAAYIDAPFFHQAHLECCPMERHGETGEMDGLCTYFASPACSYTTGQIVCVDGGWSAI